MQDNKIYHSICASFCVIVVMSNIVSAKMITLPYIDLSIPVGLVFYPLTFFLSDFVTEVYGAKKDQIYGLHSIGDESFKFLYDSTLSSFAI